MIPIVLHSRNREKTEEFLKKFAEKYAVKPHRIIRLEPEGKEFSIKQIRELIKETVYATSEITMFVLYNFDTASLEAQNAFLKTLEEHKDSDQFIMEVAQPYRLLSTILSRSRLISVTGQSGGREHKEDFDSVLGKKNLPINHPLFQIQKYENPLDIFDMLIEYARKHLVTGTLSTSVARELIQARNRVKENNITPQYALDRVLIFLYKNSTEPKYEINSPTK